FLAHDLRIVARAVDRLELAVDIDVLQLVDQHGGRILVEPDIGCRHLDVEAVVGSVAELLHDLPGLRAIVRDIGIVAGQLPQLVRRQPPQAAGRRLQYAADLALPLCNDINKRLAVDAERHRAPEFRVVEWRLLAIDDQVPVYRTGRLLADRVRQLAHDVLDHRRRQPAGDVELAGDKRQYRGRRIAHDRELDAVE